MSDSVRPRDSASPDLPRAGDRYEATQYTHDPEVLGNDASGHVLEILRDILWGFDRLMNRYAEAVELSRPDLVVLDQISQQREQPLTMGELASRLGLSTPATTGRVDRLEERGLVRRERSPVDRRRVELRTTDRADAAVIAFFAPYLDRVRKAVAARGEDELAAAARVLSRLREELLAAEADAADVKVEEVESSGGHIDVAAAAASAAAIARDAARRAGDPGDEAGDGRGS